MHFSVAAALTAAVAAVGSSAAPAGNDVVMKIYVFDQLPAPEDGCKVNDANNKISHPVEIASQAVDQCIQFANPTVFVNQYMNFKDKELRFNLFQNDDCSGEPIYASEPTTCFSTTGEKKYVSYKVTSL